MFSFKAVIEIIGVNPYVLLPEKVLSGIFMQAGKSKGPIPVKGKINGQEYIQTLVRYSGEWRLYLNTPMRKSTNTDVGDTVKIEVTFDNTERTVPVHPKLQKALNNDKVAKQVFDALPPSRQKEIVRYINFLKTEESIDRNIENTMLFLHGKKRHIGRDKP